MNGPTFHNHGPKRSQMNDVICDLSTWLALAHPQDMGTWGTGM